MQEVEKGEKVEKVVEIAKFVESNLEVVDRFESPKVTIEVEQFKSLRGVPQFADLGKLYYQSKLGIHLKRVKLTLNAGSFKTKQGTLHYMYGDVDLHAKNEMKPGKNPKPIYKGTGVVYMEPSYNHYVVIQVDGVAFVESSMWIAVDSQLKLKKLVKVAAIASGDSWNQITKVEGKGWMIIEVPYPASEIQKVKLNRSTLVVDGSFAFFRQGDIEHSVGFGGKGLMQKMTNTTGEGKLQKYVGTGEIWLAPTHQFY
eukprot:TRINITY_DN21198_c0_g1_i1.p1 TRINITY_DN21198_c0_g1~~TRINITY_DN21198_c0_g1_i1.p1  ORF type:complete len:256 (-),score=60.35 TRINITY_DN21198_c0_g1_i1:41-808(-)